MDRVALIDGDILVYEAAHRCQEGIEWDPGEVTKYADFPEAVKLLDESIKDIEVFTGSTSSVVALTDSARELNFRRACWPGYKCHREAKPGASDDGRPLLYKALREYLREAHLVMQKQGIEGDDTLGILATSDVSWLPMDKVICTVDKDLNNVPGHHYNWRKAELGVYYVTEREADRNFLMQTLTGDATDGFPGIPGIGPKKAEKILMNAEADNPIFDEHPQRHWWAAVKHAFHVADRDELYLMAMARCARILRSSDWDTVNQRPILWSPPEDWE